ncbi:hypothetical protein IPA_02560 [Ignicoccus pacificus DSM 13166]|uniref:Uncharacterized protein n=1 Tax=Ignicoccus pacificus DSM 13166 TaxID=940294 RepID=A0A977KAQ6_9CREN|nr:hypothetical protein IPA_02560 [Ignicoccus pacificus DSM 13166]
MKGLVCHASELEEYLTVIKWNEFGDEARVVSSLFGIEPSRAEANLRVGKLVSVFPLPKPYSQDDVLVRAFSNEYQMGMVVERNRRYFVEPAMLWKDGFVVLEDPLKIAKELYEEKGVPIVIVKEVPTYCCWVPLPLAWCARTLSEAGKFRKGVPFMYSFPEIPMIREGCVEVELEEGPCQAGFEEYPRPPLLEKLKMFLIPIRRISVKVLPRPKIGKDKW